MLLALGITKPVIRSDHSANNSVLTVILVSCQTQFVIIKLKRAIIVSETVFKNTTSTKKPKPNHFFFKNKPTEL